VEQVFEMAVESGAVEAVVVAVVVAEKVQSDYRQHFVVGTG